MLTQRANENNAEIACTLRHVMLVVGCVVDGKKHIDIRTDTIAQVHSNRQPRNYTLHSTGIKIASMTCGSVQTLCLGKAENSTPKQSTLLTTEIVMMSYLCDSIVLIESPCLLLSIHLSRWASASHSGYSAFSEFNMLFDGRCGRTYANVMNIIISS